MIVQSAFEDAVKTIGERTATQVLLGRVKA